MRSRAITAALVVTAALAVGGCSGSDNDSAATQAGGSAVAPGAADGARTAESSEQRRVVPTVSAEIRTATVTLKVAEISRAVRAVEDAAQGAGGLVASRELRLEPGVESTGQAVLRVPNDRLTPFLREVERHGAVLSSDGSTEDVTAQVVDVQTRVATQRRSIDRIRALLGRAASVDEIVKIEADLARREADLESLLAQQRALADRTAMATVTVRFVSTSPAPGDEDEAQGFMAGLQAGWDAFTATTVVGLTVLGAVLPFLLAAAVLAVPALVIVLRGRRLRREAARA